MCRLCSALLLLDGCRLPLHTSQVLLLVADANGRGGGIEALELLENSGYVNLVGVTGGFAAFWRVFDAKLARRAPRGAFLEDPLASGSSQGIFAGES